MKKLLLLILLVGSGCTCLNPFKTQADDIREMTASTVKVIVELNVHPLGTPEIQLNTGWVGSGVVYEKDGGLVSPVHSRILTANHVLETPKIGSILFLPSEDGKVVIVGVDSIKMSILTDNGSICNLKPLALGSNDTNDVAIGEADCDAGRVAPIADEVPAVGEAVTITGHPLGDVLTIITTGQVNGWWNGYLSLSAPAAPGNSGGPVWYNGKVIGLLVRRNTEYEHLSYATPLKSILDRINDLKH